MVAVRSKLYEFDKGEVDVDETGVTEDGEEVVLETPQDELRLVLITGSELGMSGGGGGNGGSLASESHDSDELVDSVGELDMPESLVLFLPVSLLLLNSSEAAELNRMSGGELSFFEGESKF